MLSFRSLLVPAALATALAVPATGFAQVQATPAPLSPAQGGERHRGGFGMRALRDLNLSAQQQSQIQQLIQQFRQAHPRGSKPDKQARKDLRDKIMAVLTPAQQAQLKAEMQKRHGERGNREERGPFPQTTPSPAP